MRSNSLIGVRGLALIVLIAACGGNSGGGQQTVTTIEQNPCPVTTSLGWQTEVYQFNRPTQFGYCPMVLKSGQKVLNGSGLIDVLMSKRGGVAGFIGSAALWSVRLGSGRPDSLQANPDIPFGFFAPYVTPSGEQPVRGTFAITWKVGIVSSTGTQESDSLALQYPTQKLYNCCFLAAAYIKSPVVISSFPGSITGSLSVSPGQSGSWRAITDWDTTGYAFQWTVDGAPVQGANGAAFVQTFNYAGTYMLRVDQTLADNEVLSAYRQVTVPLLVNASGNFSPMPYETLNYSALSSGGYPPYTYHWTWDGADAGTDQTTQVWAGGPLTMHSLELTITDSHGNVGYANFNIWVPTEGGCDAEPCGGGVGSRIPLSAPTLPAKIKVVRASPGKPNR